MCFFLCRSKCSKTSLQRTTFKRKGGQNQDGSGEAGREGKEEAGTVSAAAG